MQGRGARDYRGVIADLPGVEVAFLSASEIVGQLAAGAAHFGVTGEDLVREQVADADNRLVLLAPLGFGRANVVVAAPQAWIDVRTMADLEDVAASYRARRGERMRVATKYVNLTRRFFAEHGVADYRIVESLGATEGAPAAGAAELIVDITTTGATLAANALKTLEDGVILRSQATLVASPQAPWSPAARAAARAILTRIAAAEDARKSREVRARLPTPGPSDRRAGLRAVRRDAGASATSPIRTASSPCIARAPRRPTFPTGCSARGRSGSAWWRSSRCSTSATRSTKRWRRESAAGASGRRAVFLWPQFSVQCPRLRFTFGARCARRRRLWPQECGTRALSFHPRRSAAARVSATRCSRASPATGASTCRSA